MTQPARACVPVILLLSSVLGCGGGESTIQTPPLPPGAVQPELHGDEAGLLLSWVEQDSLRYARLSGRRWSEPRTIVNDERLLTGWAHLPAIVNIGHGGMVGSWPTGGQGAGNAVDIAFSFSPDGENWTDPIRPDAAGGSSQRGWVELIVEDGLTVGMISLEGGNGTTRLLYRAWSEAGFGAARELDPRVCPWCRPSAAMVGDDLLVAYRDHTSEEVRDIAVVRRSGRMWQAPSRVHEDGWRIAGCPVNGPALVARADRVALTWFTAAEGRPRVLLARSTGIGGFGEPVRVDSGDPLGRVDAAMLDDGTVFVSWLEKSAEGAHVEIRRIDDGGDPGETRIVGTTAAGPESGFPRLAAANGRLYVAWVEPSLARVRLASFRP